MITSSFTGNLSRGGRTRLAIASAVIINLFAVAAIHEYTRGVAAAPPPPVDIPQAQARAEAEHEDALARQVAVNRLMGLRGAPGPALDAIVWNDQVPVARDDRAIADITDALAPLGATVRIEGAELVVEMTAPPAYRDVVLAWDSPDRHHDTWVNDVEHRCATFRDGIFRFRRC